MDESSRIIYGILLLVLVCSALFSRRIPISQMVKMLLIWIGIFLLLFILFSFRAEFSIVLERVKSEITGTGNQSSNGQEIILTRRYNGHFWIRAFVNNVPIDFLVDSGATGIVMSTADADAASIDYDLSDIPVLSNTANGVSKSYRASIGEMKIENSVYQDVNIYVSPTLGDTNLLGMSFLNQLQSWRVSGNQMILQP